MGIYIYIYEYFYMLLIHPRRVERQSKRDNCVAQWVKWPIGQSKIINVFYKKKVKIYLYIFLDCIAFENKGYSSTCTCYFLLYSDYHFHFSWWK